MNAYVCANHRLEKRHSETFLPTTNLKRGTLRKELKCHTDKRANVCTEKSGSKNMAHWHGTNADKPQCAEVNMNLNGGQRQ